MLMLEDVFCTCGKEEEEEDSSFFGQEAAFRNFCYSPGTTVAIA